MLVLLQENNKGYIRNGALEDQLMVIEFILETFMMLTTPLEHVKAQSANMLNNFHHQAKERERVTVQLVDIYFVCIHMLCVYKIQ